jgi:3-hydroxypropanoate dehydrogenase
MGNESNVPATCVELDRLFRNARTHNAWQPKAVTDAQIREIYELAKWGPTAANSNPARFVFLRTPESKARLKPHLSAGNVEKTMTAPCCVIIASDLHFYEHLPQLFPSRDMRANFVGKESLVAEMSFRNSSLQGAYLMIAARALGLDCGPMSGFNAETLDREFFPDGEWKSNFLCNLGYGRAEELFPRNPRLRFEQACRDL